MRLILAVLLLLAVPFLLAAEGAAGAGAYTVKSGDTLTLIAREHATTVRALVAANPALAEHPDRLAVGQVLALPGGATAATTAGASAAALGSLTTPRLVVADAQAGEARMLGLAKADIHVTITGFLAETSLTLTFHNDTTRVLEGTLEFPLPENAVVTGYALNIDGSMCDGVAVEKERARAVYEEEVNKRVDPGLLEQTQGNNFRTRVYPIPAKGTRTIRITYVSDLAATKDGAVYSLPLDFGQALADVTLQVEAVDVAGPPKLAGLEGLAFKPGADTRHLVAQQEMHNVTLSGALTVTVPAAAGAAGVQSVVEKRATREMLDAQENRRPVRTEQFFAISDMPRVDTRPALDRPAWKRRIGVLWDASLNRANTDKTAEIEFLKAVLGKAGEATVEVVVFRNTAENAVTIEVKGGDAGEVLNLLEGVTYDGGADLEAGLDRFSIRHENKNMPFTYWLLFSGGQSVLGAEVPAVLGGVPVFTVSNDTKANHGLLKYLAMSSGGAYLNLQRMGAKEAAGLVGETPFSLVGVEFNPAEVIDVYPRGGQAVTGRMVVSGKLLAPRARVVLKYGYHSSMTQHGYETVETHRQEVVLDQSAAQETGLVSRFWAMQKIADLSVFPDRNRDELIDLGKQFNLVTPATSLLVLDTVEQYLQHRVVPPKSRPEIYRKFNEQIDAHVAARKTEQEAKINHVLALWQAREEWWNKTFEYPKGFVYQEPKAVDPARNAASTRLADDLGRVQHELALATTQPNADPADVARLREDVARIQREQEGLRGARELSNRTPTPTIAPAAPRSAPAGNGQVDDLTLGVAAAGRPGGGSLFSSAPAADHAKDDKDAPGHSSPAPAIITIKPWDPKAPYLKALQDAGPDRAYAAYLAQRKAFAASPAYYFDCADYLLRNKQKELGVRVLTCVPALGMEDAALLRVAAYRLQQEGELDAAIDLFEKALKLRPDEPQSHRDLALALMARADHRFLSATFASTGEANHALRQQSQADYQRAMELLHKVVMNQWPRFDEIEVVALMEANALLAKLERAGLKNAVSNPFDPRLIKNLDCDVRIVLTWDADHTDVDLWVTEPSGEKCIYNHNRTTIGGMLSHDFTDGYGPEEYCLHHALAGAYKVQANYFGSRQQTLQGPVTLQATVITNFGRPNETRQNLTVRLAEQKETIDLGTVQVGRGN